MSLYVPGHRDIPHLLPTQAVGLNGQYEMWFLIFAPDIKFK